jgi:hypothetical protein
MEPWEKEIKGHRCHERLNIINSVYTEEDVFTKGVQIIYNAINTIEKAFEQGLISKELLEKARSGVYKDNPENRKQGRVGTRYGKMVQGGQTKELDDGGEKYNLSSKEKDALGVLKNEFLNKDYSVKDLMRAIIKKYPSLNTGYVAKLADGLDSYIKKEKISLDKKGNRDYKKKQFQKKDKGKDEKGTMTKVTKVQVRLESDSHSRNTFVGENGEKANKIYRSFFSALKKKYDFFLEKEDNENKEYSDEFIMEALKKDGYSITYTTTNDNMPFTTTIVTPEGIVIINRKNIIKTWDIDDMGTPLAEAIVEGLLIEF